MPDDVVKVSNLSKIYKLYDRPIDRMKESLSVSKKTYHRDHYALKNISFNVEKGDNIGIIGTNGSGKSTLLKIITGVLTQSSGDVVVNGKISALLELGTGFNMEYTGIENIYLNGTMMGYSRDEIDKKVDPILSFANIGEFIHQPVKTYSSGMFARLAFAVAVNVDPEILIVDEALSVGDVRFQIKCMNRMKEMMQGGTTVLFVSHDTGSIRRFCTKAIWLNNGIMEQIGEVNRVADSYLDFLKSGESGSSLRDEDVQVETSVVAQPFKPNSNIAEIVGFEMFNHHGNPIDEITMDEYARVVVTYDVYEENIENPVLGVAVFSIDDDYVCGLNTLLDKVKIPWQYGRNVFCLEYPLGVRATGGKYYFNVALFEETATVSIQHIQMKKEFSVVSRYEGEGRYIMPHNWIKEQEYE